MKTPFKITFQKEVKNNISNEEIINNFITNLKIKSFNSFNKTDNNLIASNNIKSFWDFNKAWKDAEKVNLQKKNIKKDILKTPISINDLKAFNFILSTL